MRKNLQEWDPTQTKLGITKNTSYPEPVTYTKHNSPPHFRHTTLIHITSRTKLLTHADTTLSHTHTDTLSFPWHNLHKTTEKQCTACVPFRSVFVGGEGGGGSGVNGGWRGGGEGGKRWVYVRFQSQYLEYRESIGLLYCLAGSLTGS